MKVRPITEVTAKFPRDHTGESLTPSQSVFNPESNRLRVNLFMDQFEENTRLSLLLTSPNVEKLNIGVASMAGYCLMMVDR